MQRTLGRVAVLGCACLAFAGAGYWAGTATPRAEAATAAAVVPALLQSQAPVGNGAYTILPVLDGGGGYTWMAYAIAISPEGKVTIMKAHPKEESEMGAIVKQFSIR